MRFFSKHNVLADLSDALEASDRPSPDPEGGQYSESLIGAEVPEGFEMSGVSRFMGWWRTHTRFVWFVSWVGVFVGVSLLAVGVRGLVGWRAGAAATGMGVLLCSLTAGWRRGRSVRGRGAWAAPLVALFLSAGMVVGAVQTLVVAGEPVFTFSQAAAKSTYLSGVAERIGAFNETVDLVQMDQTQGRLHYQELLDLTDTLDVWLNAFSFDVGLQPPEDAGYVNIGVALESTTVAAGQAAILQVEFVQTGDEEKHVQALGWAATVQQDTEILRRMLMTSSEQLGVRFDDTGRGGQR